MNSVDQVLNKSKDKGNNPDRMTAKGQNVEVDVEVEVEVEVGVRVVGGEDEAEASHCVRESETSQVSSIR